MEAQRRGDTGRDTQRQRGEERCKTWGRTHGGTERERHRLGGRDRERHRDTGEGTESRVEGNDGQTETGCWRGAQAEWGGQEWGSCGGGQGPSGSPQTRLGLQGPLRITPGCGAPLLGGGGERRRAAGEGCPLHLGPSPSLHGGGALSVSPPPSLARGSLRYPSLLSPPPGNSHQARPLSTHVPARDPTAAAWTEACLPRSPDGAVPGLGDKRRPSNLLPWSSLPGSAPPLCGSRELGEREKGRGGGGTRSHPGHPTSPETGRPKVTRNPDCNLSCSRGGGGGRWCRASGQRGGRGGAAGAASGDPPPEVVRKGKLRPG